MIRFPTVHMATSIVNRILNAHDELMASGKVARAPLGDRAPQIPGQADAEGAAVNQGAFKPVPPVDGDLGAVAPIATGQNIIDSAGK